MTSELTVVTVFRYGEVVALRLLVNMTENGMPRLRSRRAILACCRGSLRPSRGLEALLVDEPLHYVSKTSPANLDAILAGPHHFANVTLSSVIRPVFEVRVTIQGLGPEPREPYKRGPNLRSGGFVA
ncbi:hypothetical protein B296_00018953 [Ensete ventricosum]|uniref:Uncharacterized protein n=1 Tax=Ensete ventricosum TaxID=4639 RepID=A0A427ASA3_ENSVE|nr:hypothetical protein B296_00018953 [Ensete ventricosum]